MLLNKKWRTTKYLLILLAFVFSVSCFGQSAFASESTAHKIDSDPIVTAVKSENSTSNNPITSSTPSNIGEKLPPNQMQTLSSGSLPDLTRNGSYLNKSTFNVGDTMTGYIDIINQDGGWAYPTKLKFYLNKYSNSIYHSDLIDTYSIPSIFGYSTYKQGFSYTIPSSMSPGVYYLHYWIDADGDVFESNENNNAFTFGGTVTINSNQVDLTQDKIVIDDFTVKYGEDVEGYVRVVNNGNAGTNSTFKVRYYLNQSQTSYSSSDLIDEDNIYGLGAGSYTYSYYSYKVPNTVPAGTYYLHFEIDATDVVSESNEGNNNWNVSNQITITAAYPDLTRDSATLDKTVFSTGDYITGNVYLHNQGNASTNGQFRMQYYLSTSKSYPPNNKIIDRYISTMSAGSKKYDNFSYQVPSSLSDGTYYLHFLIDAVDHINESKEDNNFYVFNDPIIISNKADLTVTDTKISNLAKLYTGDIMTVQARVRNIGSVSAHNVGLEVTLHDTATAQKYYLQNISPSSIGLMTTVHDNYIYIQGKIPTNLPFTGSYKARVSIDPGNLIAEQLEDNNKMKTDPVTIERLSYAGTGGSGGTPSNTDYDNDGYPDVVEKKAGTSLIATNKYEIKDSNYRQALAITPDINQSIYGADPVNLRTGALELTQEDFKLEGRGFPIKLTRIYNSKMMDWDSMFGYGWNFKYNNFYYQDSSDKSVQIYLHGNRSTQFTTQDNGVTYIPARGEYNSLINEAGSLVYKTLDGNKYYFSKKLTSNLGLIEKMVDTNNNTLKFGYTTVRDIPFLSTITDASGRVITFTYGNASSEQWDKVVLVTEKLTGTERNIMAATYDSSNRLSTVTYTRYYNGSSDTAKYSYTYDSSNRLLTYTDPRGVILYNDYDSSDRVITQYEHNPRVDQSGAKRKIFALSYTGPDAQVSGSNHCTILTTYRDSTNYYDNKLCFNSDELKIYESDGLNNVKKWSYNALGLVSSYTDQNSQVTTYSYDSKRRKTAEKLPDTSTYSTDISYTYENNFNRLTQKTVTSTVKQSLLALAKNFKYGIDSTNGNLLSVTDPRQYTENYLYDSYGNISKYTDKNGNYHTYTYDSGSNYQIEDYLLVNQIDSSTQPIVKKNTYDSYGNKKTYTTPNNNVYTYEYDSRGNLRKEIDPNANSSTYQYDLEDHMIKQTDKRGKVTNYTYDTNIVSSLLKSEQVSSGGNITEQISYDYAGNRTEEIDPLGNKTTYTYNKANQVSKKVEPIDTVDYTYYPDGNLKTKTNSLGQKTEYIYDTRGNKTEERNYLDATNYISTKFNYDGWNRLIDQVDPIGNTTSYSYDRGDLLIKKTNADGGETNYSYKKNGNLSLLMDPLGNITAYTYDEDNRLIKEKNPDNKETIHYYDREGKIVKKIDRQTSSTGDNKNIELFQYDSLGRLSKKTDAYAATNLFTYDTEGNKLTQTDEIGRVTTYTYDDFNRLLTRNDPAGNITTYSYDKSGNITQITYPDSTTEKYEYNNDYKLIKFTDQKNNFIIYSYDKVGNKISETNQKGFKTQYDYDGLNRLVKVTDPKNNTTQYSYDKNGNKLTDVVNGNSQFIYAYDKLNRSIKITQANGKNKSFSYDKNSNIVKATDEIGNDTEYTYDKLNRLVKMKHQKKDKNYDNYHVNKYHGGNLLETLYWYDNWDNNIKRVESSRYFFHDTCPKGVMCTQGYKTGNLPVHISTNTYKYDLKNRLYEENYEVADYTHDYIEVGEPFDPKKGNFGNRSWKYETSSSSYTGTIKRAYDKDDNLAKLTDSANRVLDYSYTNNGLVDKVKFGTTVLADYDYDGLQRAKKITYGNGVIESRTYDSRGNQATQVVKNNTKTLIDRSYSYDKNGNRTKLIEAGVRTTTYGYDILDQLITVDYSNIKLSSSSLYDIEYSYDSNGNRVKLTDVIGTMNYSYNNSDKNQLSSYSNDAGLYKVDYTYHNNGGVSKKTVTRQGTKVNEVEYKWGPDERLEVIKFDYFGNSLVTLPSNVVRFIYDDEGNRTYKRSNKTITNYINSGVSVLSELNEDGTKVKTNIYGLSKIAEIESDNSLKYIHADNLGSALVLTDTTGKVVETYDYKPFGSDIGSEISSTEPTSFRFTDQEFDSESDMYYYNARYYDPIIGRFISPDPVIADQGTAMAHNQYVYVRNNPTKYTDTTGEYFESIIDVAFIAVDVGMLIYDYTANDGENATENWAALGMDVVSLALPGAAGLGRGALIGRKIAKESAEYAAKHAAKNTLKHSKHMGKFSEIEAGVNFAKKKKQIPGLKRYPDDWDQARKQMLEVKSVKKQSYTKQIRETSQAAHDMDHKYILETLKDTKISGPLKKQFKKPLSKKIKDGDLASIFKSDKGKIIHRPIGYTKGYNIGVNAKRAVQATNPFRYTSIYNQITDQNQNMSYSGLNDNK